jgi:hypothetical protein
MRQARITNFLTRHAGVSALVYDARTVAGSCLSVSCPCPCPYTRAHVRRAALAASGQTSQAGRQQKRNGGGAMQLPRLPTMPRSRSSSRNLHTFTLSGTWIYCRREVDAADRALGWIMSRRHEDTSSRRCLNGMHHDEGSTHVIGSTTESAGHGRRTGSTPVTPEA